MPSYIRRDPAVCGNCIHFRQHYAKTGPDYYFPIPYGHCTFPRQKRRMDGDSCPHWRPIPDEAEQNEPARP